MSDSLQAIILSFLAGVTMFVGGFLARIERIRPNWLDTELRHSIIAFGGGALIAAVALVLVPHGMKHHSPGWAAFLFLLGGGVMMAIDRKLSQSGTPASNLIAMLSDFLPEAIALGAALSGDGKSALLLAGLIAMQNLPEGFNAYREMIQSGKITGRAILLMLLAASLLGPLAALAGLHFLKDKHLILGGITLAASGGILYLVFQDVAPQASLKRHWSPALGALLGFALGMVGKMLTG